MPKLLYLTLFLFVSPPTPTLSINISYTLEGYPCITECIPWTSPNSGPTHYCYSKWAEWNYCIPGIVPALDYYTSNNENCTSLCGLFGDPGGKNWCYTKNWNGIEGQGSATWDYCITAPGLNVLGGKCYGACEQNPTEYQCGAGSMNAWNTCSPPPTSDKFVSFENRYIKVKWGFYVSFINFLSIGTFKEQVCAAPDPPPQPMRTARQGGIDPADEEQIRHLGVVAMSAIYRILFPLTLDPLELNPPGTNAATNPITEVRYEEVPAGLGLPHVRLVRSMHAIITRNHIRQGPRAQIPYGIWRRMDELQYVRGTDERGHLVMDSMGGPPLWYNFAPQTNVVNRNYGFGGRDTDGSWWFRAEGEIRNFFNQNPTADHVSWDLILTYNNTQVRRRPTGYGLRYLRHFMGNNPPPLDSGDMVFNNDENPFAANSVC